MKRRLSRSSVKESLDNLPSGIAYFSANGLTVLCNKKMHELVFDLTGQDLQMLSDIENALADLPEATSVTKDGELYRFPDGTVWQFTKQSAGRFTEYVASDVTELHRQKIELQKSTAEHLAMVESMKRIVDNVVAITREEELLSIKMNVHGKVGWILSQIRMIYSTHTLREQKAELAKNLENVVTSLRGEIGYDDVPNPFEELCRISESIGVKIVLDGTLPTDVVALKLLTKAVRECVTNTLRHAKGDRVLVKIRYEDKRLIAVVTNNGSLPEKPIVEGGGLGSLRLHIEKAGGTMVIRSLPHFELTVCYQSEVL